LLEVYSNPSSFSPSSFSLLGVNKDDNGAAMGPAESQHPIAVVVDEGEPKDRGLAARRQGRARVRRHGRR